MSEKEKAPEEEEREVVNRAGLTPEEARKRRLMQYWNTKDLVYQCGRCGEDKLGSDFYWDQRYSNGRDLSRCKKCRIFDGNARAKTKAGKKKYEQRVRKQRRRFNKVQNHPYQCQTCKEMRIGSDFYFHERRKDGVNTLRCRNCASKKRRIDREKPKWEQKKKAMEEVDRELEHRRRENRARGTSADGK